MKLLKYNAQNRIIALAVAPDGGTPTAYWDESVPDSTMVEIGWTRMPDGSFAEPAPAASRLVTRRAFARLFTAAERIGIRTTAESNPQLADLYELMTLDDTVNLEHPDVAAGIGALQAVGLLTASRAAAILANQPPA